MNGQNHGTASLSILNSWIQIFKTVTHCVLSVTVFVDLIVIALLNYVVTNFKKSIKTYKSLQMNKIIIDLVLINWFYL